MTSIGTPLSDIATRVLLCGGGELGRELAIELQRMGVEVVVADSYKEAPAMHVAHRAHVIALLDGESLRDVVVAENPDFIVPTIEALHAPTLVDLEHKGYAVVPSARTVQMTGNREAIRRLAHEELGLQTSAYAFADTESEFARAAEAVGFPCVAKPVMCSTGLGVSVIGSASDLANAWSYAQEGGRVAAGRVIVEARVEFDYEVMLLVVRHAGGVFVCEPVGHRQLDGTFAEAWQPHVMPDAILQEARGIAGSVVEALGGHGVYAVELFVCGEQVLFNTVTPRPHEAGVLTLVTQELSQFELHLRAALGLPIPPPGQLGAGAASVVRRVGTDANVSFMGLENALAFPATRLQLFAATSEPAQTYVGMALARGANVDEARQRARDAAASVRVVPG